jgi:hypothetical protein
MSTKTKHGGRLQPGDLWAYRGMLLSIASEAVANSVKPISESHRETKLATVQWLNDEATKAFAMAKRQEDKP